MADQARGIQTSIAIFEEDTFGADPGVPDGQKIYVTSFGLAKSQNRIDSETLSNSRGRVEPFLGNINASGSVATEMAAESSGTLFKHLMGVNTTTGSGPYSHALTIGDLPTSLMFELDYGSAIVGTGRYAKYNGCKINNASFDFPTEGACTASFDVVGVDAVLAAAPLDASLTDNGATTFSSFSASIEEGGVAIASVKSVSMTVANGLDEGSYVIGSGGKRVSLPDGFSTVSGTLTAVFDSTDLMNKALGDTETSLKITVARGDGLGTAGNESIEFLVQQMKYDPTTPSVNGPGGIEIALPFKAYKIGTDLGLAITLKNNVATI